LSIALIDGIDNLSTSPPLSYLVTPSPFIPLPLDEGKGEGYIREAKPLFDSCLVSLSFKGEGEDNRRGANVPLKHPIRPDSLAEVVEQRN